MFFLYIGDILAENIITDFIDINAWWEKMSRFDIFWRYFIFNLTENFNMKWVNAQMANNKSSFLTHWKIDLCDLIKEDDILAIRTADENFPNYIMNSTTRVVQLWKSHVDRWGSEFSAGDQVLHGYYYEQVGNDFLHQRLVKKYQSNSAEQNCNLLL